MTGAKKGVKTAAKTDIDTISKKKIIGSLQNLRYKKHAKIKTFGKSKDKKKALER